MSVSIGEFGLLPKQNSIELTVLTFVKCSDQAGFRSESEGHAPPG